MKETYSIITPPHGSCVDCDGRHQGRINWIDWAKAIGIFLVVTGHSHYYCEHVVPLIFMIHMPLFFVVSGYLFKTSGTLHELTWRSFRGLVVPYVLYNLLVSLYWLGVGGLKLALGQPYNWEACVTSPALCTIHGYAVGSFDGPTWFLLALVWCKYVCWLLHRGRWWLKVLTVVVWGVVCYFRSQTSASFLFAIDCGMVGFIWFEIGYSVKQYVRIKHIPWWASAVGIVMGSLICVWVYSQMGMCNYILCRTNGLIGIAGTASGLVAFFSLCHLLSGTLPAVVCHISKASIVVMCLHMPIQSVIEAYVHYQGPACQTLAVDLVLVLLLTASFPVIRKCVPWLVGGR